MIELKDIKGIVIYHKTLGGGRVVDLQKDILYVQFGDQVKGFQLPLAFESIQPSLKCENPLIQRLVTQIKIQNSTCSLCGKASHFVREIKKQRLCLACCENAPRCRVCGRRVCEDTQSFQIADMCDACFSEHYFLCDACREYNKNWDEVKSDIIPEGEHWCRFCLDLCCICEREIKLDKTTRYTIKHYTHNICPDCQKTHIKKCKKCKTTFLAKDIADRICDDCKVVVSFKEFLENYDFSELWYVTYSFYNFIEDSTVELMSRLNGSCVKDPFDVLFISNVFEEKLVVVSEGSPLYNWKATKDYYDSCTLTEFKKSALFYKLIEAKMSKMCSVQWSDTERIDFWKKPVHIRAQTYADMDYRKEWEGGDLVYEGNNYGDTSDFYIVGKTRKLKKP